MRRRDFIRIVAGSAASWPLTAHAQQQERMRRIGVLMLYPESDPQGQLRATAFRQGLEKLGWVVGRNVQIDFQWGLGDADWIRSAAAQLLGLAPDVIPCQRHAGGEDDAAGEPRGCRDLHRQQRPGSGWPGAEPGPPRRQLDRLLRF